MKSTDFVCECGFVNCTLCPTVGTNQDEPETDVTIYPTAKIIGRENLKIGNHVIVDDGVFLSVGPGSAIGSYTHIAYSASVLGQGKFTLGDFASVAAGARIYTGSDDLCGPFLVNPAVPTKYRNAYRAPVSVGKHAVVGSNSVVMPGTVLGEGTVVGANTFIKEDSQLIPWGIYFGSPARLVKMRDKDGVLRREKEFLSEATKS